MRLRALPVLIAAALAAAQIVGIAESVRRDLDLSAAIIRVTVGGREVVTAAVGDSMTGIPRDHRHALPRRVGASPT